MRRRVARRLVRDERGGPSLELALLLPFLLILLMGLAELTYESYVRSVLVGAVAKAGRDSGIQGGASQTAAIDQIVKNAVLTIAKGASFTSNRENFDNYAAIGPEPFTDGNKNNVRDPGECYTDINNNGQWDADPGSTGQGGANDITLYVMTVSYPRLFPLAGWLGWGTTATLVASTILKNQPYANQVTTAPVSRCTP